MSIENDVRLTGNLGNDPDVRYSGDGKCITKISLATTSKRKDKDGNVKEDVQWHRVVFFGRLAEIAGEYLRKGSMVQVNGSIRYGKYEKDGVEKYSTDIIADEMKMLGGKQEGQGGGSGGSRGGAPQRERPQRATDTQPMDDFADDDIPFISQRGNF